MYDLDANISVSDLVLVLKLSPTGTEITRLRLEDGDVPRVFPTSGGYVVLDNLLTPGNRGLRQTFLDFDLKVTSQRVRGAKTHYMYMEAASEGPRGGFHVAGYDMSTGADRGKPTIRYLSGEGDLLEVKIEGWPLSSREPVALVPGNNFAEAVLLQRGDRDEGMMLTKLRISN
ncbi:MAG: hypothetical protein ABI612_08710 [Betaproteobacteria bacterium]